MDENQIKELNENIKSISDSLKIISEEMTKLGNCVTYFNSIGRDRYVFNASEPTVGRLWKNKFLKNKEN